MVNPTKNEGDALATLRVVPKQIDEHDDMLRLLRKRRNDAILYLHAQGWSNQHIAEWCSLSDVMIGKIVKTATERAKSAQNPNPVDPPL